MIVRRLTTLQPNSTSIHNLFLRLIVAFIFRYLPVELRQKIYNLVMPNNTFVGEKGRSTFSYFKP